MSKPIIPLEARTKAIELVLGDMQQKQAARPDRRRRGLMTGAGPYQEGRHVRVAVRSGNRKGVPLADCRDCHYCFASIFLKQFLHYFSAVWAAGLVVPEGLRT